MIKSAPLLIACFFCASSLGAESPPKIDKNPRPLDPKNMDASVKPEDDFFSYANGGWIKRTEIPPEYSRWGSFNQVTEQNNDALHAIVECVILSQSCRPTKVFSLSRPPLRLL
jgi:putative endopeptidase